MRKIGEEPGYRSIVSLSSHEMGCLQDVEKLAAHSLPEGAKPDEIQELAGRLLERAVSMVALVIRTYLDLGRARQAVVGRKQREACDGAGIEQTADD